MRCKRIFGLCCWVSLLIGLHPGCCFRLKHHNRHYHQSCLKNCDDPHQCHHVVKIVIIAVIIIIIIINHHHWPYHNYNHLQLIGQEASAIAGGCCKESCITLPGIFDLDFIFQNTGNENSLNKSTV